MGRSNTVTAGIPTVRDVSRFLEEFAPSRLAEEWDNVGLLVGRGDASAARIMTCLTITPATAAEAVDEQAQLIVTHHPLPFRPLKRLTDETTPGGLLLQLIKAGIAVYSPHTAFDSAKEGINQRLAQGLGLQDIRPLRAACDLEDSSIGAGRYGLLPGPLSLDGIASLLKDFLKIAHLQVVGDPNRRLQKIAVACGSAGEFLAPARDLGCEALLTGETSFHTCLEAEAKGVALLLCGHYASERFAVERLAEVLAQQFPAAQVWASRQERDPLAWW
jgi:dinuclear metal center YbgI/SA1388 family protein